VARQIQLNNELVSNSIKSDEELAVKRAQLEKASISDRASSVQAQIGELEGLKERGVISQEEYVRRRRSLANEELQIASDASNAEVALKEANNAKILKGLENASRDRNLATRIASNNAQIGLTRDELNPNVSNQELAVKSTQVGLNTTRSELSNTKAELEDLNKAFAQGALNEQSYLDKAAALKGSISDLGLKEAQAELALRKAINDQLLKQYELAKQTRDLEAKLANNAGRSALIRRQLDGPRKLESEDIAIKSAALDTQATDRQIANTQKDLSDLQEQFNRGLIKIDDFKSKSIELKGQLSDLSVQRLNNELAELEARNAKALRSFERSISIANAAIDAQAADQTLLARQSQFSGGEASDEVIAKAEQDATRQRIALKQQEIAGIKKLVEDRVITENEGTDRILAAEADLRSQRMNLLDSQVQEYNRLADAQISAIERASSAQTRAFEKQKAQLSNLSTLLDRQGSIVGLQRDLANAQSEGVVGQLEARQNERGEAVAASQRLRSGDVGENERRVLERQIGGSGNNSEVALLKQQQAIARQIEDERLRSLDRQENAAQKLLKIEETKLRIAQQISVLEAKNAENQARVGLATAQLQLSKAQRTGTREEVLAAQEGVRAASDTLGNAQQSTQFVKSLGSVLEQELGLKRDVAAQTSANSRNQLINQSITAERERQRTLAAAADRAGLSDFNVGGRSALSNVSASLSGGAAGSDIAAVPEPVLAYQNSMVGLTTELVTLAKTKAEKAPPINEKALKGMQGGVDPRQFAREESQMAANVTRSYYEPMGSNSTATTDTNKYQNEQLTELRNIANAIRNQKPSQTTQVFQGGQDSVQQYLAVSKARQSAAK
jgi:hypothetical protein